tara:strand:- start:31 stop:171 length:141 start_codon:yes stop_codon:yes gene_type:complete
MLEACVGNALKKGEEKKEPFKLLAEEQSIIMSRAPPYWAQFSKVLL